MQRFLTAILCVILSVTYLHSGDNAQPKNSKINAKDKLQGISADSISKLYPKKSSRLSPAKIKAIEKFNSKMPEIQKGTDTPQNMELPEKMSVPGEFDESQAVLISWPSFALDKEGNVLYPLLPGIGLKWLNDTTYELTEIDGYLIDLFAESPFPPIWGKLAQAIQRECQVWIRISDPEDTTALKQWMAQNYSPLTNYKFISDPDGENAYWMRDFGPYGVYYGDQDSLAFVKMEYYPDRPIDNNFPLYLAEKMNIPIFVSQIESEGGNYMTDGWGRNIYSNVLFYYNQDTVGQLYKDDTGIHYKKKTPMTNNQVNTEYNKFLPSDNRSVLPHLWCDGGTGHIDIYLKMIDDETIITTEFPPAYNTQMFTDYNIIRNNQNNLGNVKNTYNRNFQIKKLPLPTDDNGNYSALDCDSFNKDARNYINGLLVNKSFIFPIYSNNLTGNKSGDDAAVKKLQELMPGFNIVPIDARVLTPMGGAIHCITMQIPAENPIRIWHPSITGYQEIKESFELTAKITNRSGISSAKAIWRKAGSGEWSAIELTESDGVFSGAISGEGLTLTDSIEYYISAESNNGKTLNRPITAPDGYYTFYFSEPTSVERISPQPSGFAVYPPQPNPVSGFTQLKFSLATQSEIEFSVYDMFGRKVVKLASGIFSAGEFSAGFDSSSLPAGIYIVVLQSGKETATQKVIVGN